jgi:hypothetical protein
MRVKIIKASQYNDAVWQCLKLYLSPQTILSCVYRSDQDQLDIIVERAKAKGYKFQRPPTLADEASWRGAWHAINTKLNPVAKPGFSKHRNGIAYDLGGPDLPAIVLGINKAAAAAAINLAPKRHNFDNPALEGHCIHVEILGGKMDFEPFDFA